ncbi:MAG: hypothetical protein A3F84_06920 [Candidatus Handelsmanbacteria bacterium RIFCSPLOWO2_12_FULL_64_10]|uniref:DUF1854 domain-containing protein n=1 Tax=Handelsmanbacteria sp. (strain RIFCSPLOWO2_12_FULL_64_10) TaxID=1817868 RepID=A0A1F6D1M5_HANXR|nr:MAG: hypothetical protein A3F84_06920 [Candidatus Handelsmanbacteria bacterium RIFCSPLOWO2_12_FULL_64_10]
MEQEYALKQELNLLDPKGLRLFIDEFEDLTLDMKDRGTFKPVTAMRAFPITDRDRFIILKDQEGQEIGIVRDASDLDPKSRAALIAELERVYFMPKITFVHNIEEQFHIPKWEVETDRGPRVFEIRSGRHNQDLRSLGSGRILIRDADGNQYEIPDYRKLDPVSQTLIESQI